MRYILKITTKTGSKPSADSADLSLSLYDGTENNHNYQKYQNFRFAIIPLNAI